MEPQTVELIVKVNLDAVPGSFHTVESAQRIVQQILVDRIEHYEPRVYIK